MNSDMKWLVDAATQAFRDNCQYDDSPYDAIEPIVRAVLMELRETSEDFQFDNACVLTSFGLDLDDGRRVTDATVRALIDHILAEPATA